MTTSSHSPEFINEMKQKLEAEQAILKTELDNSATYIDGEWQAKFPEYGEDDESNAMEIDQATAQAAVVSANAERLREIEAALGRIESSTYGLTVDGHLIPEDRLRANPAATTILK